MSHAQEVEKARAIYNQARAKFVKAMADTFPGSQYHKRLLRELQKANAHWEAVWAAHGAR